jgi:hypothetical protein
MASIRARWVSAIAGRLQLVDHGQVLQHGLSSVCHGQVQLALVRRGQQLIHLLLHRVDGGHTLAQGFLEIGLVLGVGGLGQREGQDDVRPEQVGPLVGQALLDQRFLGHGRGRPGHRVQPGNTHAGDQHDQQ